MTATIRTEHWGLLPYQESCRRQERLVEARRSGKTPDTFVLAQHPPIYTLGSRVGGEKHLLLSEDALQKRGLSCVKTRRGGSITYHGPGQWVGYLIVSLEKEKDLHAHLRRVEALLLHSLKALGVHAHTQAGRTGAWVGSDKIASIGMAARHWIAYHGFALNVHMDLEAFKAIVPCGIPAATGGVTQLAAFHEVPPSMESVAEQLQKSCEKIFHARAL